MSKLIDISLDRWDASGSAAQQAAALQALEDGQVLLLPALGFPLRQEEQALLNGAVGSAGSAKNISWEPARGVRGHGDACDATLLAALMQRYARHTQRLLAGLLPGYSAHLQQGKGSFRPVEIAGRVTSWRKDDTRLHVDSFPSSPTQGRRILRVFTNIQPRDAPACGNWVRHSSRWRSISCPSRNVRNRCWRPCCNGCASPSRGARPTTTTCCSCTTP